MIRNDEQLAIERRQLRLIEEALESLRLKLMPNHPKNFALYSEGYVEQIDVLKAEIDEYVANTQAKLPDPASLPKTSGSTANVP